MSKSNLWLLGILAFASLVVWGRMVSFLMGWAWPDVETLPIYLVCKGTFALVCLIVMSQWGGLRFFELERGQGWWFPVPGSPFLLLGVLVLLSPNARFELGFYSTCGWVLAALWISIGEESVFRGILWKAVESRGELLTAFTTSLFFGAAHLAGLFTDLPWQIVASQAFFAFGVGMMLAAVRLFSGALLAPIGLHFIFDAAAIVAAGGINEMLDETLTVGRLLVPGAIFAVWGLACIGVVKHRRARKENGMGSEEIQPAGGWGRKASAN